MDINKDHRNDKMRNDIRPNPTRPWRGGGMRWKLNGSDSQKQSLSAFYSTGWQCPGRSGDLGGCVEPITHEWQ
jgi:hypothetical protein